MRPAASSPSRCRTARWWTAVPRISLQMCIRDRPVLVIPNNDAAGRYYLLAGHKRLLASKMCGREYVPAIIRKDLPPGLEGIYITDTNLQYGVKYMLPSEKCRTLWEQHQSIKEFRQYCRLHAGESSEIELGGKVIKFGHLEKTREVLAATYGLAAADVQRYLSLHTLNSTPVSYTNLTRPRNFTRP